MLNELKPITPDELAKSTKTKVEIALDELVKQATEEKDKRIAELDCQMKRNIYCYSCANATERCFKNEIGCPCGKYKSYKKENAKAKEIIKELLSSCFGYNSKTVNYEVKAKAEDFIKGEENDIS